MKTKNQGDDSLIESLQEEQQYIKDIQVNLFENFNILLENQKSKVDNQDLIIENQDRIIGNQDIIVNNLVNILKNQKKIVQNQVTLAVILKTQIKILEKLDVVLGLNTSPSEIKSEIDDIYIQTKAQFESGEPDEMLINS